jgi:hypothetical protein
MGAPELIIQQKTVTSYHSTWATPRNSSQNGHCRVRHTQAGASSPGCMHKAYCLSHGRRDAPLCRWAPSSRGRDDPEAHPVTRKIAGRALISLAAKRALEGTKCTPACRIDSWDPPRATGVQIRVACGWYQPFARATYRAYNSEQETGFESPAKWASLLLKKGRFPRRSRGPAVDLSAARSCGFDSHPPYSLYQIAAQHGKA